MAIINFKLTHPNPLLKREEMFPFSVKRRGKGMSYGENGIALIIVVSIVAVLASIAAAFSYSMIMDQRAAANYMNGIKADYVARAGIQHAIGVLKMDGDPSNQPPAFCSYEGYDWYGDDWGYDSSLFGGDSDSDDSNINNDGSDLTHSNGCGSGMDSRWIYMTDSQGHLIGRYAVLVIDESGKVNINTAGTSYGDHGWTTKEIKLDTIFSVTGDADKILDARYGDSKLPGADTVDDNADSVVLDNDGIDNDGDKFTDYLDLDPGGEGVDDPAEFYISRPYTDSSGISADTPFVTVAEIVSLAGLSSADYNNSSFYITAFSSDKNLTDSGLARLNINAVSDARELYLVLRDVFDDSVTNSELAQMAVNIIDYRDRDNGSTRIDVGEITRYGVEGIRINEVMVRPVFNEDITDAKEMVGADEDDHWADAAGFGYQCDSSGKGDTTVVLLTGLTNGTYKLKIYGHEIEAKYFDGSGWIPEDDDNGDWYEMPDDVIDCDTVIVNTTELKVKLYATAVGGGGYADYLDLSQSPDCEYVELVNISPNSVDVGGWHLEFPNGQVGTIPSGKSIDSGDTVVLAIDRNDTSINNASVYNNGISFQKSVTDGLFDAAASDMDKVWQLTFTNTIPDDEIISDTVLMDSPLRLYDGPIAPTTSPTGISSPAGHIVDQVLWDSHVIQVCEFYSMERNDPTFMGTDAATNINVLNDSGIFDSWIIGTIGGTPTKNTISSSINVKNSPFANIGEIADVSDTAAWKNIGFSTTKTYKVKAIADRITVSARRLDAEFATHEHGASGQDWFSVTLPYADDEIKRKYGRNLYDENDELYWFRADSADEDTWTWYTTTNRFEADTYIMYVYGREGGTMRVRVGNDSAIIIPSSDYGARYGRVVVSDTTLEVAIKAENPTADSTYFDYILLTPASKTYGRLNINTATATVLCGLQNINTGKAANIVGYADKPFKTIGELLDVGGIGIPYFQKISNLITTKSNVFKIICTGQSVNDKDGNGIIVDDEILGERKITVIYER